MEWIQFKKNLFEICSKNKINIILKSVSPSPLGGSKEEFEDWLKKYIFWELDLLKLLGYDLELQNLVKKSIVENETIYYANSSTEKKYVPNFLIEKDLEVNDLKTLLTGLKLVGDYLDKTILKPNNLNYPNSRLLFINSLK